MVKKASFILSSEIGKVEEVLNWIHSQLDPKKLSSEEIKKIDLAVEEAVVNVIEHSYERKGGELDITLNDEKPGEIVVVLKDAGPPFDPLAFVSMIQEQNLIGVEKKGGLGVLLMCRAMDHIHYERDGKFNVLTLSKKLRRRR